MGHVVLEIGMGQVDGLRPHAEQNEGDGDHHELVVHPLQGQGHSLRREEQG